MKLEDYLRAIKDCPDAYIEGTGFELLEMNHGITDSWEVMVRANFHEVIQIMTESGKFRKNTKEQFSHLDSEDRCMLEYIPGTNMISVYDGPLMTSFCEDEGNRTADGKEHLERQKRDYNMGLVINPYNTRRMKDNDTGKEIVGLRAIAIAAEEIGQIIIKNNIPACLPWTRPKRYIPGGRLGRYGIQYTEIVGDCSSIVYFP